MLEGGQIRCGRELAEALGPLRAEHWARALGVSILADTRDDARDDAQYDAEDDARYDTQDDTEDDARYDADSDSDESPPLRTPVAPVAPSRTPPVPDPTDEPRVDRAAVRDPTCDEPVGPTA